MPSPTTKSKARVYEDPSLKSWSKSWPVSHGPRSSTTTRAPPAARWYAAIAPPKPLPTTRTSVLSVLVMRGSL